MVLPKQVYLFGTLQTHHRRPTPTKVTRKDGCLEVTWGLSILAAALAEPAPPNLQVCAPCFPFSGSTPRGPPAMARCQKDEIPSSSFPKAPNNLGSLKAALTSSISMANSTLQPLCCWHRHRRQQRRMERRRHRHTHLHTLPGIKRITGSMKISQALPSSV